MCSCWCVDYTLEVQILLCIHLCIFIIINPHIIIHEVLLWMWILILNCVNPCSDSHWYTLQPLLSAFPTHDFLWDTTVCTTVLSSSSKFGQAVTFVTCICGSARFEFQPGCQSSWQIFFGFPQYFQVNTGVVHQISPWLLPYNLLFTCNSIIGAV